MEKLRRIMKAFWQDEEGQGIIEYILILGLIVIAAVVIMTTLGGNVRDQFSEINDRVQGITPGGS